MLRPAGLTTLSMRFQGTFQRPAEPLAQDFNPGIEADTTLQKAPTPNLDAARPSLSGGKKPTAAQQWE